MNRSLAPTGCKALECMERLFGDSPRLSYEKLRVAEALEQLAATATALREGQSVVRESAKHMKQTFRVRAPSASQTDPALRPLARNIVDARNDARAALAP